MPVILTIRLLFVMWTNAPFLLHIIEASTATRILISRGGKFRGRKISRNSIRSGYYFRGRKISRKIPIREYSENFLHAKNWCYTVILPVVMLRNESVKVYELPTGFTLGATVSSSDSEITQWLLLLRPMDLACHHLEII